MIRVCRVMVLGVLLCVPAAESQEVTWDTVKSLLAEEGDGVHVSLSYCTLCGSGVLYGGEHPSRDGKKPFTFGSSGLLYRSNKLMYDRPTNSLWSNLTGEPVAGRLADSGIQLERLPLVVTTWDEWRRAHPDTLVLDVNATGFASADAPNVLVEDGTGERWTVREDTLFSASGETLPRIAGHDAFWFGWYAFFPTTEIYGQ